MNISKKALIEMVRAALSKKETERWGRVVLLLLVGLLVLPNQSSALTIEKMIKVYAPQEKKHITIGADDTLIGSFRFMPVDWRCGSPVEDNLWNLLNSNVKGNLEEFKDLTLKIRDFSMGLVVYTSNVLMEFSKRQLKLQNELKKLKPKDAFVLDAAQDIVVDVPEKTGGTNQEEMKYCWHSDDLSQGWKEILKTFGVTSLKKSK